MNSWKRLQWWLRIFFCSFALLFLLIENIRLADAESTGSTSDAITQSDEGQAAEKTRQHHCCARHEKMIDVGEGISRQVIKIDAGLCRRFCPRDVYDDPGDLSKPAVQICPPNSHCHPRAARLERVSTLQGVKVIETVDTCDCSLPLACRRESFKHLVHSGTPYQVVIDVGVCMGSCDKDLSCKPHRNRTVSVKGPNAFLGRKNAYEINRRFCFAMQLVGIGINGIRNFIALMDLTANFNNNTYYGIVKILQIVVKSIYEAVVKEAGAEIYQSIDKCGCAGNCHRMDHTESVLDFSEIEIKDGTNTSEVRPVVREINVGQCVGSCPGNETETCLLRDKKEPTRCLASLYSKQYTCTPASFKVHEYRTRRGSRREVIQIAECACF